MKLSDEIVDIVGKIHVLRQEAVKQTRALYETEVEQIVLNAEAVAYYVNAYREMWDSAFEETPAPICHKDKGRDSGVHVNRVTCFVACTQARRPPCGNKLFVTFLASNHANHANEEKYGNNAIRLVGAKRKPFGECRKRSGNKAILLKLYARMNSNSLIMVETSLATERIAADQQDGAPTTPVQDNGASRNGGGYGG